MANITRKRKSKKYSKKYLKKGGYYGTLRREHNIRKHRRELMGLETRNLRHKRKHKGHHRRIEYEPLTYWLNKH